MIYIILVISYITSVLSVAKRATEDLKCIKMNVCQSLSSSTKTISSPSSCTSISKNCCYINMTYSYINFDVSSQYCFSLSGNLNDFKEYINNLYQDDILYFANYTYRHKAQMKYLGRQFDYNYTKDHKCFKAPSKTNYSTYLQNNCGQFDKSGACISEKDTYYFSNFTQSFYRNYSSDYCNKADSGGKCISYNGTRSNNAMVRPLIQDLIGYLHIDEPDYVFEQDELLDVNPDDEETVTEKWPTGYCSDIPKVNFEVICPDSYQSCQFITFSIVTLVCILFYFM